MLNHLLLNRHRDLDNLLNNLFDWDRDILSSNNFMWDRDVHGADDLMRNGNLNTNWNRDLSMHLHHLLHKALDWNLHHTFHNLLHGHRNSAEEDLKFKNGKKETVSEVLSFCVSQQPAQLGRGRSRAQQLERHKASQPDVEPLAEQGRGHGSRRDCFGMPTTNKTAQEPK